jgi:hypothetical protein
MKDLPQSDKIAAVYSGAMMERVGEAGVARGEEEKAQWKTEKKPETREQTDATLIYHLK